MAHAGPQALLQDVIASLALPAEDWERRVAGLRQLASLAPLLAALPDAAEVLLGLHATLSRQILDRRSAVAREALESTAHLATSCGRAAEQLAVQLYPALMAALATTMGVVCEAAEAASRALLAHAPSRALLCLVCATAARDRNARLRGAAARHALRALCDWDGSLLERGAEAAQAAAAAAVVDASAEVRAAGKELWAACAARWPDWAAGEVADAGRRDAGLCERLSQLLPRPDPEPEEVGRRRVGLTLRRADPGVGSAGLRHDAVGPGRAAVRLIDPAPLGGQAAPTPYAGLRRGAPPLLGPTDSENVDANTGPNRQGGLLAPCAKGSEAICKPARDSEQEAPAPPPRGSRPHDAACLPAPPPSAAARLGRSRKSIGGAALRVALANRACSLERAAAEEGEALADPGVASQAMAQQADGSADPQEPASSAATAQTSTPHHPPPPSPAPGAALASLVARLGAPGQGWRERTAGLECLARELRPRDDGGGEAPCLRLPRHLGDRLAAVLHDATAEPHARVAAAGLDCLARALASPGLAAALEAHLDRLVPCIFLRMVDVKEALRQGAEACLAPLTRLPAPDALCAALAATLAAHRGVRVRAAVLAFALASGAAARGAGGATPGLHALLAAAARLLGDRAPELRRGSAALLAPCTACPERRALMAALVGRVPAEARPALANLLRAGAAPGREPAGEVRVCQGPREDPGAVETGAGEAEPASVDVGAAEIATPPEGEPVLPGAATDDRADGGTSEAASPPTVVEAGTGDQAAARADRATTAATGAPSTCLASLPARAKALETALSKVTAADADIATILAAEAAFFAMLDSSPADHRVSLAWLLAEHAAAGDAAGRAALVGLRRLLAAAQKVPGKVDGASLHGCLSRCQTSRDPLVRAMASDCLRASRC
ncbi:CLASP1 [Auxenochlorella protothecoides x Auxenochlorella symbiontica]